MASPTNCAFTRYLRYVIRAGIDYYVLYSTILTNPVHGACMPGEESIIIIRNHRKTRLIRKLSSSALDEHKHEHES